MGLAGAARVTGSARDDRIAGGGGGDRIEGRGGDDLIFGFGASDSQPGSDAIEVQLVGEGFERPVYAAAAPGDPGRLYVVEQHTGRIEVLDVATGGIRGQAFLDLPDGLLADGGEQGLLGLAFHPDYEANGRFFVYLTRANGDVELRELQRSAADPNRAEAGGGDVILRIDKDNGAGNHNGGWIGFGPDGMLHIAVGDEGEAGDPSNNAQNRGELWGKMLRIDVDRDAFPGGARDYAIPEDNPFIGVAGRDEIWALGLRNPWRASFDRATGDLWIGDVGQGAREEIDLMRAGTPGGANFGWKVMEGELVFDDGVPGNPRPGSPALVDPLATYGHGPRGGVAVVGGYVHRGEDPGMQGRYLYADFGSDQLWSLRLAGGRAVEVTNHRGQLVGGRFAGVTSFAEDELGNLYAVGIGGSVSRLVFGAGSGDGADRIFGGRGHDRLFGGAGDDLLEGGPGRDELEGGGQDDRLSGGRGADLFVFEPGSGRDVIADFRDDVDAVRLGEGFGFARPREALAVASGVGGNLVFDFGGGDRLTVLGTTRAELADDLLV
jgi:glucose/arabinose dehydrogenase